MLEDFEKKIPLQREPISSGKKITTYIHSKTTLISELHKFTMKTNLIRPINTCFATSYLTSGCLNENKGLLIRLFAFKECQFSQFINTRDGVHVENLILDDGFWIA